MTSNHSLTRDTIPVSLEDEMRQSYLDYAMSVIVSRALPDVRDGLKPVHRRILHAMNEANFDYNKPYRKSARVTGEVMGKYHPHGNVPIYEAMVRMAQDFSMGLPLIDGQGNFGSMDGDPPAAERYTEARLAKIARFLLDDIDKDTVDFKPNYDESSSEPIVLPARYPNLLVNGAGGIAVGMATNMPPHNLVEIIQATCALIDNPDISIDALLKIVPGPDFPTGGIIMGQMGCYNAAHTGRGSILMRGKTHVEEVRKDRQAIIVTEIPYQVNKARMIERMAQVVKEKIIEGISDLRDESDRDGVRVVIELKRDASADVVLNQLYRFTPLQTTFGVNALALDRGQPRLMNLKNILQAFIDFREEVVERRVRFNLTKARNRAHVLMGLGVAVTHIDQVIAIIKSSSDPQTARERLMAREWPVLDMIPLLDLVADEATLVVDNHYRLTETQARAILELRLHRLTGLEQDKIQEELNKLTEEIKDYLIILSDRNRVLTIIKSELLEISEAFGIKRRSYIEKNHETPEIEDLIECEHMVITVSQKGYIKRVPLMTYRAQKRGGKGRSGMSTRDEDFVNDIFIADTHTPVLFFTNRGLAFVLKVYRLPLGSPQSLGKAMINLLPLSKDETISTVLPLPKDSKEHTGHSIVFVTSKGNIRRNALHDFLNIKANGKIAMKLEEGETLVAVKLCHDDQDIMISTRLGKCIRFPIRHLRMFASRNSTGVRGIRLGLDDTVIAISILRHATFSVEERNAYIKASRQRRGQDDDYSIQETLSDSFTLTPERYQDLEAQEQFIITITDKGYGKRTSAYEYRVIGRGGQGIANMELTPKNGQIVGTFVVNADDQLIMVTNGGQMIRCPIHDIRIAGRKTQGVTLFKVPLSEKVVSVALIPSASFTDNDDDSLNEDILP